MDQLGKVVIFITTGSKGEAERIAKVLLDQRKASCVSIIPKVDSWFFWEGKLERAFEVLLVAKTKTSLIDKVVKLTKEIHSYDIPEIIALPIISGNQDYLEWIEDSVS